jgi:hypothetical protein
MREARSTDGKGKKYIQNFGWNGRVNLEDLGVDGKIISEWISGK